MLKPKQGAYSSPIPRRIETRLTYQLLLNISYYELIYHKYLQPSHACVYYRPLCTTARVNQITAGTLRLRLFVILDRPICFWLLHALLQVGGSRATRRVTLLYLVRCAFPCPTCTIMGGEGRRALWGGAQPAR